MKLRKEVHWFAEQMERKLRLNDHKGHWAGERFWPLFHRLRQETDEVLLAAKPLNLDTIAETLTDNNADDVIRECADVANFAMMLADLIRAKKGGAA